MSFSQLCILRTHQCGPAEEEQLNRLRPYFGENLVVALDTRAGTPDFGQTPVVPVNDDVMRAMAIEPPGRWGWRCGDVFLYAARQAYPDYDYYWMIEPDVLINLDKQADWFSLFDSATEDFIAHDMRPADESWKWHEVMKRYGGPVWRCLFPLTRSSGRLIDGARVLRQAIHHKPRPGRVSPNDESLVATVAANNFTHAALADYVGADRIVFETVHLVERERAGRDGKLYHPALMAPRADTRFYGSSRLAKRSVEAA